MDKEPDKTMRPGDKVSIDAYGFADDYFNELPRPGSSVIFNSYMDYYKRGEAPTYSERYADQPAILEASDPTIVEKIDDLMREIIAAAQRDDADRVRELIQEIRSLRS